MRDSSSLWATQERIRTIAPGIRYPDDGRGHRGGTTRGAAGENRMGGAEQCRYRCHLLKWPFTDTSQIAATRARSSRFGVMTAGIPGFPSREVHAGALPVILVITPVPLDSTGKSVRERQRVAEVIRNPRLEHKPHEARNSGQRNHPPCHSGSRRRSCCYIDAYRQRYLSPALDSRSRTL